MSGSFYSPEYRQSTLDRVLDALEADERITGVLVVGSGSVGFDDDYSDIDLCIVCPDGQTLSIYQDWRERFEKLLPVIGCSPVTYGPHSHLYALLLDGFLELDAGFIGMGSLAAKRERWKVAFDRSGNIADIMTRNWANRPQVDLKSEYLRRADGIWHHILHVRQALRRRQVWRARHYLETVRNLIMELAGIRLGLEMNHFRDADKLPNELLSDIEQTIPTGIMEAEILHALACAVDCFFREAYVWDKMLDLQNAEILKPRMYEFLHLLKGEYDAQT